jgi:hypothetical protein
MSSTLDINKLDLYAILHVSEEATEKEVQDQQQLLYTMNYSSHFWYDYHFMNFFFTADTLGLDFLPATNFVYYNHWSTNWKKSATN